MVVNFAALINLTPFTQKLLSSFPKKSWKAGLQKSLYLADKLSGKATHLFSFESTVVVGFGLLDTTAEFATQSL